MHWRSTVGSPPCLEDIFIMYTWLGLQLSAIHCSSEPRWAHADGFEMNQMETLCSRHGRCLKVTEVRCTSCHDRGGIGVSTTIQLMDIRTEFSGGVIWGALPGSARMARWWRASLTDGTMWAKRHHRVFGELQAEHYYRNKRERKGARGNEMRKPVWTMLLQACMADFWEHFLRTFQLSHCENMGSFSVRELI